MGWHHPTDSARCMRTHRCTCLPNTRQFGFSCTDASSQQSRQTHTAASQVHDPGVGRRDGCGCQKVVHCRRGVDAHSLWVVGKRVPLHDRHGRRRCNCRAVMPSFAASEADEFEGVKTEGRLAETV